jgi:adenosylcobinamide-GDP ribazoletransferase
VRFEPRREVELLLSATQFLTRLPIRPRTNDPDWLPRGAKYFPLVGVLVGCIGAAILVLAARFWAAPLPQSLAVTATLLATGALHEDGMADCADSLGGWTRERRLEIMKDSRLGTYGALALLITSGLQVASLSALPAALGALCLVAAHAAGRLGPVLIMAAVSYAGDRAASRIEHRPERPQAGEVALAALFGLAPLVLLPPERAAIGLLVGGAAASVAAVVLCRRLGGYTGDVLGGAVVVFYTVFLLGVAAGTGRALP